MSLSEMVTTNLTVMIQSSLINHMLRCVFRVSPGSQAARAGDYINLISADIERTQYFCSVRIHDIHDVWVGPLLVLVYSFVLVQFLGLFTIIPIGMFIAIMIVSYPGGRLSSSALSRAAASRGERSKTELDVI